MGSNCYILEWIPNYVTNLVSRKPFPVRLPEPPSHQLWHVSHGRDGSHTYAHNTLCWLSHDAYGSVSNFCLFDDHPNPTGSLLRIRLCLYSLYSLHRKGFAHSFLLPLPLLAPPFTLHTFLSVLCPGVWPLWLRRPGSHPSGLNWVWWQEDQAGEK